MLIRRTLVPLAVCLALAGATALPASAGDPDAALPDRIAASASTVKFVDISAGTTHALAVTDDGQVYAWGSNSKGELGLGTVDSTETAYSRPVAVPGMTDVVAVRAVSGLWDEVAVRAASGWSAALTDTGQVYTWGGNAHGQLGQKDRATRPNPTRVPGLPVITAIEGTGTHMLAVAADGSVWGWGINVDHQVNASGDDVLVPTRLPGLSQVKAVAAGWRHSLALNEKGEVWAWGSNTRGALGLGDATARSSPTRVAALTTPVKAISAGRGYSFAITATGIINALGSNIDGQLGLGSDDIEVLSPRAVSVPTGATQVAAGTNTSFAVGPNWVYATGRTHDGELGMGEGRLSKVANLTSFMHNPALASPEWTIVKAAANQSYGLALTSTGTIRSWGYVSDEYHLPLGLGVVDTQSTPAAITQIFAPPEFAAAPSPTIAGGGTAGVAHTAELGTWSPAPNTVTYRWFAAGKPIDGATAATYTPTSAQVGAALTVQVTARTLGYHKTTRTSQPVVVTAPASDPAPPDSTQPPGTQPPAAAPPGTQPPSADGFAAAPLTIAQPTTVATGKNLTIGGLPAGWTATYQWYRNGKPIAGATGPTYKITAADAGAKISAIVTIPELGQSRTIKAVTVKLTAKVTAKIKAKSVVVTLKVPKPGAATGKVKLTLTKTVGKKTVKVKWSGKSAKTVTLKSKAKGKATVKLPKLPKGKYKVTATFAGNTKAAKATAKTNYKAT
ncbi:MAG: hypothetical protein LBJ08_00475 [Bifidobacteriaceae bacterium]|jgi:alpha-tubulin suppressor-like RCC1 family protein|nr:hypothetical protein [Bifidobacteriaceae bacterium]